MAAQQCSAPPDPHTCTHPLPLRNAGRAAGRAGPGGDGTLGTGRGVTRVPQAGECSWAPEMLSLPCAAVGDAAPGSPTQVTRQKGTGVRVLGPDGCHGAGTA